MKKTFVISAFPCSGKTFCFENYQSSYSMLDSDSSEFSWIKDKDGNNTTERNPEFPNNYIEHIKSNIGKVDVIFVSSHDVVRKALYENHIKTVIIYPDRTMKDEWIRRLINRNSPKSMIDLITNNWYKFIDGIRHENYPFIKIVLYKHDDYIDIDLLHKLFNDDIISEFLN